MLIKNKLEIVIQQELSDSKGRLLSLNVKIKDKNYRLINVYGPNKDAEAICFYQNLSSTLRLMELDGDDNVIIGGNFNCPLDPTMDKKGGILIPRIQLKIFKMSLVSTTFGALRTPILVALRGAKCLHLFFADSITG